MSKDDRIKASIRVSLPVATVALVEARALNMSVLVTRLLDLYIANPAIIEDRQYGLPAKSSIRVDFDSSDVPNKE